MSRKRSNTKFSSAEFSYERSFVDETMIDSKSHISLGHYLKHPPKYVLMRSSCWLKKSKFPIWQTDSRNMSCALDQKRKAKNYYLHFSTQHIKPPWRISCSSDEYNCEFLQVRVTVAYVTKIPLGYTLLGQTVFKTNLQMNGIDI